MHTFGWCYKSLAWGHFPNAGARATHWSYNQSTPQWKIHRRDISYLQGKARLPLSPLLFAFTMPPLMEYLEHKLATREIEGIKITENLTICHRLSANDVDVFIPAIEELHQTPRCFAHL